MSVANKIGLGLNIFGKTTGKGVIALGKGIGKGFAHVWAGMKGNEIADEANQPERVKPKSKYRRARA